MNSKNEQMPKEVSAAISTIIKFLEKTEKDFLNIKKSAMTKEEKHENS